MRFRGFAYCSWALCTIYTSRKREIWFSLSFCFGGLSFIVATLGFNRFSCRCDRGILSVACWLWLLCGHFSMAIWKFWQRFVLGGVLLIAAFVRVTKSGKQSADKKACEYI